MRTVNIGDLKNQLSAYLQYVRNGEEVVIRDRNVPIARILPISADEMDEDEQALVAAGLMKLPERPMDWDAFWTLPSGNISTEDAVRAVLEDREGGW